MTQQPTIANVCQDVIDRVKNKKFVPIFGRILEDKEKYLYDINIMESVQKVIQEVKDCHVCAKGALALAWIEKNNKCTSEQLYNLSEKLNNGNDDNLKGGYYPEDLLDLFGRILLDEIEIAYEGRCFWWHSKEITIERIEELKNKYSSILNQNYAALKGYKNQDIADHLIRIMQDIINGEF